MDIKLIIWRLHKIIWGPHLGSRPQVWEPVLYKSKREVFRGPPEGAPAHMLSTTTAPNKVGLAFSECDSLINATKQMLSGQSKQNQRKTWLAARQPL